MSNIILFITFLSCIAAFSGVGDRTTWHNQAGKSVALAAIQKVQDSHIFKRDNFILYRTAYAETNFQKNQHGMWNVNFHRFLNIIKNHSEYERINEEIKRKFDVDFEKHKFTYYDCSTPLSDALLVRFAYDSLNQLIPLRNEKQVELYKKLYAHSSEEKFKNSETPKCHLTGANILFLIASGNLRHFKQFIIDYYVNEFNANFYFGLFSPPSEIQLLNKEGFKTTFEGTSLSLSDMHLPSQRSRLFAFVKQEVNFLPHNRKFLPQIAIIFADAQFDIGPTFFQELDSLGVTRYIIRISPNSQSQQSTYAHNIIDTDWNSVTNYYKKEFVKLLVYESCNANVKLPLKSEDNKEYRAEVSHQSVDMHKSVTFNVSVSAKSGVVIEAKANSGHPQLYSSAIYAHPSASCHNGSLSITQYKQTITIDCAHFEEACEMINCKNDIVTLYVTLQGQAQGIKMLIKNETDTRCSAANCCCNIFLLFIIATLVAFAG